jgi:hypothetical protein
MTGRWFSLGTPVSYTNKTDSHDTTEISLKMALSTIMINSYKILFNSCNEIPFKNNNNTLTAWRYSGLRHFDYETTFDEHVHHMQ